VRRLTENKEKYFLSKAGLDQLAKNIDLERVLEKLKAEKVVGQDATWKTIPFYKTKEVSEDEGYKGRIGIHEVMQVSETLRNMIIEGKPAEALTLQAQKEGMLTMFEDGIFLAVMGITTIEEVYRVISE
jgi:type II secretory ATPase GspE/PulE/Tfp pilus assembly ATPase PilB-like protein